jgi:hypothetical protein
MYAGLVLQTVPFTDLPPPFFCPAIHFTIVSLTADKQQKLERYCHAENIVWTKIK